MWNRKNRRRIAELTARVQQVTGQRDAARRDAADFQAAAVRTAGRFTLLADQVEQATAAEHAAEAAVEQQADRIERLLRACIRYRRELARAHRDIARLQARLDDALGLNAPAVAEGEHWQDRRLDKTTNGATA